MTNPAVTTLEQAEAAAAAPEDARARHRLSSSDVTLSNRQKVAVVLAQLGPKRATTILREMTDPDAIELTTEIANLPSLDTDTVVGVLGEFVDRVRGTSLVSQGGLDLARQFLSERLGKARADEVLDQMESKLAVGPLAVLATADPRRVVGVLAEQQPQTVAVLLAHMRAEDAARIIGALPPEFRIKVARRIAQLDRVDPAAVRQTTTLIEAKLRSLHTLGSTSSVGGASAIAEILTHADRNTERQILGQLEAEDTELAEKIRANLFTFEDVVALDDRSLQQILRKVHAHHAGGCAQGRQSRRRRDGAHPSEPDRTCVQVSRRRARGAGCRPDVPGRRRAGRGGPGRPRTRRRGRHRHRP